MEVPEAVKEWYWERVKGLTLRSLIYWIIIAIVLPVLSPLFKGVTIATLPSLHWYINAFIVIVLGIVLIFWYAAQMNRLDQELESKLKEGR
jgi:putative solute:sodium symporter small subunit